MHNDDNDSIDNSPLDRRRLRGHSRGPTRGKLLHYYYYVVLPL